MHFRINPTKLTTSPQVTHELDAMHFDHGRQVDDFANITAEVAPVFWLLAIVQRRVWVELSNSELQLLHVLSTMSPCLFCGRGCFVGAYRADRDAWARMDMFEYNTTPHVKVMLSCDDKLQGILSAL